jgi:lipopolysaccharide export system protein LptA
VDLQQAHYIAAGEDGSQSFAAVHAIVHLSPDGTPQRVDAAGDVALATDAHGQVTSQQMQMELGPEGQARNGHFAGNVRFASEDAGKKETGGADDAQVAFDGKGRPTHALMNGNVSVNEQAPAAMRQLNAATMNLTLAGGGKQPSVLRAAEAFGPAGAHLQLFGDSAKGRSSTDVKADRLTGRFDPSSSVTELTGLDGTGHTTVERIALNPAGAQQSKDTSQGELLHLDFEPGTAGRSELARAEQKGSVTTVHEALATSGPKKGQPEVEHSRSDDAVFDAASDTLHLIGAVEVQDEASALFANQVDVNRATGESMATGSVRVAYVTTPTSGKTPQEPVHVLAARALGHKSNGLAEFFADPGGRVRMWQETSQVEAPQIDFYQKDKRLIAHGAPGSDAPDVRTVLAGNNSGKAPKPGKPQTAEGPIRVLSRSMVYTDAARTVEFTGGVRVLDQDGTMTSQQATVWLTAAQAPAQTTPAAGFMGGKVDRIIATGNVVLDQPGRKGTGEKLVYTAAEDLFVLTGTPASPPRVVDQAQGTTTGAALKFHSGDDSIEILGSLDGKQNGKQAGRVRTETRMSH